MKFRTAFSLLIATGIFFGANPTFAESLPNVAPLFEATLGAGVLSRAQNYTDTLPERIPSGSASGPVNGSLPGGVTPFVAASYYPFADGKSFAGNFGLVASFDALALGKVSALHSDLTGKESDASYYRYVGGVRGRFPIELGELGLTARYAGQEFSVREALDRNGRAIFPTTAYGSLEFVLDGIYRVGDVSLGAYFGYLAPLSFGELGNSAWFPNAHGFGLTGGGHFTYFFSENFGLSVLLDTRSYGLDFNPVAVRNPPELDRVAGGMTDRYVSMSLGITFRLSPNDESPKAPANQPKREDEKKNDSFDSFD